MNDADKHIRGRRLVTPSALPGIPGYGWLTVSAVRHMIFQARSRKGS